MEVIKMPPPGPTPAPVPPLAPEDIAARLKEDLDILTRTLAQRRAELAAVTDDTDLARRLALYIREHYKDEIAKGLHAGRTLADVVLYYLGRERAYSKAPWRELFQRVLMGRRREWS